MPEASGEPIDIAWLDRVTFGDPHLRQALLQLFREEYAGYPARMRHGGPADRIADAHRLRGAATGIGAAALAELAGQIEAGGAFGRAEHAELEARLAAVLRSIAAMLR